MKHALSTVHFNGRHIPTAPSAFASSRPPSPADARRLTLIREAVEDLDVAVAAGHGQFEVELGLLGGHVTAWLTAREGSHEPV